MIPGSVARLRARGIPTSLAAPEGADLRDVIDIVRSEGTESAQIARASRILDEVALQIDLSALFVKTSAERAVLDDIEGSFDPEHPVISVISSPALAARLARHRERGASISTRIVSTRRADHVVLDAGDEYALTILAERLMSLGWRPSEDSEIEQSSSEGREVRWDSTNFDAGVPQMSGHVLDVAEKPSRSSRLAAMLERACRVSPALSGLPGGLSPAEAGLLSTRYAAASRPPEFEGAEESMRDLGVDELLSGAVAPPHSLTRADLKVLRERIDRRYALEVVGVSPTIT